MKAATETHFLNVDLDIFSKRDLGPILTAFGGKVIVLYSGCVKRTHRAHLELAKLTKNADNTIIGFCGLIEALPSAERQLWDEARQRDFNVGVQAAMSPYFTEFVLSVDTLQAASKVGARIVFTIYAPEKPRKPTKKGKSGAKHR